PPQFGPGAPPRQDGTPGRGYGQRPPQQPRYQPAGQPGQYGPPQPACQPQQPYPAPWPPAPRSRPLRAPVGPRRGLPPYPWHKVRFPRRAFPRSRRRGPSAWRLFYLGRHPVALLMELCIMMLAVEVIVGWVAVVAGAWMMWVTLVTMAWLGQLAAAAVRR
ncbi:MAG: hypothetical protein ACRDN0_05475, partial [Trebonia sp.]